MAHAAGKTRDDAWMADLASTCFSGEALRYYDSLEPDVRYDWTLLRRALLTKYPRRDNDEGELLSEASRTSQVYVPAAVLGPTLQPRVGRIKVIGANSTDFEYIGDENNSISSGLGAGAPATEASTFSYVPGSKLFEIQIKRPGEKDQVLGVHWYSPAPSTAIGSLNFAALTAFR
ncbi:hypothetical protein FRC05_003764 [Tulasnella sp. 425]|nr:hypothetical protein FRC05_003764 [Tulasnella sp. 425]